MRKEIAPVNHQTRSQAVLTALREAILTGNLKPGERLIQEKLAENLKTSRMPIREAISQLEKEGFVIIEPYKGAVVSALSLHDLEELYTIRANLESLAARLAADRLSKDELRFLADLLQEMKRSLLPDTDLTDHVELNRRFHQAITEGSRYITLVTILDNLWDRSMRYRLTQARIPGRLTQSYREHEEIYRALAERRTETAGDLASRHVLNTASVLMNSIAKQK